MHYQQMHLQIKILPTLALSKKKYLRKEEYLREENGAKTLIIKQLTQIKTLVNPTNMLLTTRIQKIRPPKTVTM